MQNWNCPSHIDTPHRVTTGQVRTWMQAPVFSLHKLHTRAHRLGGMWDTFVIGSILSGQAILTCKQKNSMESHYQGNKNKLSINTRRRNMTTHLSHCEISTCSYFSAKDPKRSHMKTIVWNTTSLTSWLKVAILQNIWGIYSMPCYEPVRETAVCDA